ncbi:MAG: glycine-rich protein [Janthinobacterium lividum]
MLPYSFLLRPLTGCRPVDAAPAGRARRALLPLLLLGLAGTAARAQTTTTYAYTGGAQTYTVPAGITAVQVVATGGSGGLYLSNTNSSYGARVQATVAVTPGEVLTVLVGGRGGSGSGGTVAGGYNDGGNGAGSGAGGGASDVRRASAAGSTGDYLSTRNALVVAGGGGGSDAAPATGGNGGTPTGGDGTLNNSAYAGREGGGASQTAPGSAGTGGNAGSSGTGGAGNSSSFGCGGGGGYYGGGGSGRSGYAGGGGGSSWVMPTGSTGISYSVAAATGAGSVSILPLTTSYAYTGGPQTYTVPAGVTAVRVVATGAGGGVTFGGTNYSYGARAQATVLVTPGEVLTVQVGGQGASNDLSSTPVGGYNGGGSGNVGGAGGGASDVRRASAAGSTSDYLPTRNALVVAGGGGGSDGGTGGNGGTPNGGNGTGPYPNSIGYGATQSGPGAGSGGGSNSPSGSNGTGASYDSGGGGGYYGGGGGSSPDGSGGGSSWVMPTGSTGISYSVASATGNGAVSITPVPLDDLVVSTAGQTIGAGLYNSITVLSGGVGTLAARTFVAGSTTVASGGTLDDGCTTLSGPGSFTLAAGGTLRICSPDGISATGSTGSIQVTGTRSFSPDASYVYTRASVPVTGPGLPATVRALAFTTSGGNNFTLTLTNSVTATAAATLSNGVLLTGANTLTLGPTATLSEDAGGYVTGTVQTTRPLATAGQAETFGGLGLTLTPSGAILPGSTLVRRVTGTALSGAGTSQSVRRYFDIQPTVKTGLNVSLALTVRDDELNSIAGSRLRLFKSDDAGASWQQQAAASFSSTAANGSQPLTYTASLGGIGNFSLWTLGDVRNPLPVELVSFTATTAGPAAVALAWATASEVNSTSFEVERSLDGRTFTRLGTVAAAGSSSSARSYQLLDAQLPAGAALLYYRLKQMDLDGTFSYSPVRTVALTGAAAGLSLFPNPAHSGAATLTGAEAGTVVTVYDALGRPVATATADATGTAALVLPAGLATGVYVVRTGATALRLVVE